MVLVKRGEGGSTVLHLQRPPTVATMGRFPKRRVLRRNHNWFNDWTVTGDYRIDVAAISLFLSGLLIGSWIFARADFYRQRWLTESPAARVTIPWNKLLLGKVHGDKATLPKQLRRKKIPTEYQDDLPPYGGQLHHALYTLEARRLGPKYTAAFDAYDAYIEASPLDAAATAFAQRTAAHPAQSTLLQTCYELPDYTRFHSLIERGWDPDLDDDVPGAKTRSYFQVQGLNPDGLEGGFYTADGKWEWWRSLFAFRPEDDQEDSIRDIIHRAYYDTPGEMYGVPNFFVSGCFWYPPGAFREWHTNYDSARHEANRHLPWRMFYVRQISAFGSLQGLYNQTAMHLLEGPGLSGDYLQRVGGLSLTNYKEGTPNVCRIHDRDGQVGFFCLQMSDPFRWHTIVSHGPSHRFSLGLGSHSDVSGRERCVSGCERM